jgi:hypothetical protein
VIDILLLILGVWAIWPLFDSDWWDDTDSF